MEVTNNRLLRLLNYSYVIEADRLCTARSKSVWISVSMVLNYYFLTVDIYIYSVLFLNFPQIIYSYSWPYWKYLIFFFLLSWRYRETLQHPSAGQGNASWSPKRLTWSIISHPDLFYSITYMYWPDPYRMGWNSKSTSVKI